MAGALPCTSALHRVNCANRSLGGRTLSSTSGSRLPAHRTSNRATLMVVAAKGKKGKGAQVTYDPASYEEEIASLPPLEFVIEEEDIPVEEDWNNKGGKKGKGKGKKQKKKSSWDEEEENYMPAGFATAPPPPVVSSFEEPAATVQPLQFVEEEDDVYTEPKRYTKPSRSTSSYEEAQYIADVPQEAALNGGRSTGSYEETQYAPQEEVYDARRSTSRYEEAQYGAPQGRVNDGMRGYSQGRSASTRGRKPAGQRKEDASGTGWYDPEKRKAWADKRARVFSRVTTQEINAAGTWEEVADIIQARDRILDHIHVTAALTVVSKVTDLNALQEEDQERFEKLLADIYRKLYQMVDKLGPRELATNLMSLARLGYTSDEVVQALLTASLPKLKQFNAIELSNAVYALGQMSYVPFQDWVDVYFEASEARLSEFKPLELANSINALSQLNQLPPQSWLDSFFAQAQATLQGFTPRDTATMLYGLGILGARPSDEWLLACTGTSMKGLRAARVTDLKRGVWALSQFDYTPDFKWQNSFVTRAKSMLDYFSAEDLLTTTLAMAYLRFSVVDPDFVRRLFSKIQERRGRFDEESIGNLNNALDVLGHKGARIQPVVSKAMAMAA